MQSGLGRSFAAGVMKKVMIDMNETLRLTENNDADLETEESMSSSEAATVEEMVNQEQVQRTQRAIMGVFVVYVGKVCGIHPIKAPYFCSTTECKKLRFRDRLNFLDIAICLFNTLVCINHIYIRFFSEKAKSLWTTNDQAKSVSPLLVIVASICNSSNMDRMLYMMSNRKKDIVDSNNHKQIRKWSSITCILNVSFGLIMLLHFGQVLALDFIHYNFHQTDVLDNDFMLLGDEVRDVLSQVLLEIDRRYFNLMRFAVMKVPQIMMMMVAIEIGIMFGETTRMVVRRKLTRDRLQKFFDEFRRVEAIQAQLENTFNKTVFVILGAKLIEVTMRSYTLMRFFITPTIRNQTQVTDVVIGPTRTDIWNNMFWVRTEFALLLFGCAMRFAWTLAFVLSLVYCNEKSREALPYLLNKLANEDGKNTKDQLIQKFNDFNWGLTMGKFIRIDRSALVTMISIVFTIVAVWLQITTKHNGP